MFSYKQLSLCLSFIFSLKHFMVDLSNKRQSHFAVIFPATGFREEKRREQTDCVGKDNHNYNLDVTESNYLQISCHTCAENCQESQMHDFVR